MTVRPVDVRPDQRDCALYRFICRDPRAGYTGRILGYVGETARMPFQRLMEHVYEQPWSDTIVGWEVDETTYAGKDAVLAAEEAAIKGELPLYNIEHNMDNPRRIKPWDAVAQRQAREPGWTPRKARAPRQRSAEPVAVPPPPSRFGRWWLQYRRLAIGLSGLWLAMFAGLCWVASSALDAGDTAIAGTVGSSAPFVLAQVQTLWQQWAKPKRRRRGRR